MSMHPSLERVGMRVASEQDRMLAGAALPDADLLLAGVAARRALAGRRANVRRGVIAAATSAMLVVLVVFLGLRARSTHVTVAATTTPALHARQQPDLGVRRAESGNLPLAFVDGTNVVVKRGSVAELREVGIHRGVIALTSGTVDVHVVHTETSRWDVLAGPFDVRVTGTRFDATWDPKGKKLTVAMVEGTVRVSGPCVTTEPLSAPMTKTFMCDEIATSEAPTTSVHDLPSPTETRSPPTPAVQAQPQAKTAGKPGATTPADGEREEAESTSALLARGDAARLRGDTAGARQIYTQIRQRSPRSADGAKAAFLLGRIAEASGSADEAVRWYATVTREGAGGAFAQEALGRELTVEKGRGNAARARALADDYVRKHPKGPYQAYAASVLDER